MRIAVIGPGRMGRPIVDRLRSAGHELRVLMRRPETQMAATTAGLNWRGTIAETVEGADIVFCVVLSDAQVRSVCLGTEGALAAMKPGAILVQHTTSDPATVSMLEREAAGCGIRVLDAALSGGPHDIVAGRLTLWVGGDEAVLTEVRPVLSVYASPILFVGALGNGQRVKLVNNALFVAQVGLAIDAVRLASELGISESAILTALPHGSSTSRALEVIASGGTIEAVAGRIGALMSKDVDTVRDAAGKAGVGLGIIGTVLASHVVRRKVLKQTI